MQNFLVEGCANSPISALNAQKGGANRVELCSDLKVGGITPSREEIEIARKILKIPIHVLIRPRSGNFVFSNQEFKQIVSDIEFCKAIGCNGVVIGALNKKCEVEKKQIKKMVESAYPMSTTFHKAFDSVLDIKKALRDIIDCGCDSLLTAGKAEKVKDGMKILKELVALSKDRIELIAGGGVDKNNVKELYNIGVRNFHLSGSVEKKGNTETSQLIIREVIQKINTLD